MPDEAVRYTVTAGSSLYMSGEQDWYVRVDGKPGIRASFRARPHEAEKILALLNGREDERVFPCAPTSGAVLSGPPERG